MIVVPLGLVNKFISAEFSRMTAPGDMANKTILF